MAAQLTATNGFVRARRAGVQRARRQLLARARLAGDEDRAARVGDLREQGEAPAASPDRRPASRARAGRARPSGVGLRLVRAAAVSARRRPLLRACATSNGLIRKSRAPACIALTASGISALPLIAITGVPGACMRAAARISKPLTPGMRMSVRIRSKRSCLQARVAAGAVDRDDVMTRRRAGCGPRLRQRESSSSQRRILPMW